MMQQYSKNSLLVVMADAPSKNLSGWTKDNALAVLDVYDLQMPEKVLVLGDRGTCYSFEGFIEVCAQDRGVNHDHNKVTYGSLSEKFRDGKFFSLLKNNGYEETEIATQAMAEYENLMKAGLCIIEEPSINFYFVGFPEHRGKAVKLEQKKNELGVSLIELIKALSEVD